MAPTRLRLLSSLLAGALLVPSSSTAFDSPLSDTAVREAYFLGQRHDAPRDNPRHGGTPTIHPLLYPVP